MSERTMPGTTPPANGLPEFRPYVYRGLGYDQLDPRNSQFGLRAMKRVRPDRPVPDGRCRRCGYLLAARGHRDSCGGES